MDSLRQRDYLFPKALPSDEMITEGGGQQFAKFLSEELISHIDGQYRTKPDKRTLLGHSFGGYFSLYALLYQIEKRRSDYHHFVAASPTLWYHDFYLKQLPDQLKKASISDSLSLFLSVGSMEDTTWSINPVLGLSKNLDTLGITQMHFTSQVYNSLDHMDVGLLVTK